MEQALSAVLAEKEGGGKVAAIEPGATVAKAVRTMNEHRIGSVLVMEGERLRGIFTERDVLVRIVAAGLDPAATRVRDVMTSQLVTVRSSTTVGEAMRLVTQRRCRHLPVVDDGKVTGMVSIGDLTRWMVRDQQSLIEDLERYIMTG